MAFLAPIAGLGGGVFGNLALAALGIGIQLAAAYFFPQKVKGPRAESLKAQTSKYGDQIARVHGSARVAAAVIWLKDDHVDEHKNTERQGKALGPEVTTFTYTADFAVAFAWNGPVKGIPRMWADDKLILDKSAESLQDFISGTNTKGIGVAKGASIRIYTGTSDQTPDPNIEADRGVGKVPAWPNIVYAVIRNFPLDEFGIRIPNIEAEVVKAGDDSTISINPTGDFGHFDILDSVYVSAGVADFSIHSVPSFDLIFSDTAPSGYSFGAGPYITQMGQIAITAIQFFTPTLILIYDAAGGGLLQTIPWLDDSGFTGAGVAADISISGIDYLFITSVGNLAGLTNSGESWEFTFTADISSIADLFTNHISSLSAGPDLLYMIRTPSQEIYTLDWSQGAFAIPVHVTPPGLEGDNIKIAYHSSSDSVIIVTTTGVFVYEPDLSTLLIKRTGDWTLGIGPTEVPPRIFSSNSTIIVHDDVTDNVWEYQISDLTVVQEILFSSTVWDAPGGSAAATWEVEPTNEIVMVRGGAGTFAWFLPRIARGSETLASVIAQECGYVDLPYDVSLITGDVRGYAVRDAASPRGVLEDLMRVKFFDFTQSNATTKFFMRTSTATRSLTIPYDLGFAAGSDINPQWVKEDNVDFRELPERIVIDYQSWDADYRMGSQVVSAPEGSTEANVTLQFQTSLVMLDDEAAQAADILFNELTDAGFGFHSSVGPKFLELHPGDVVNLDLEEDVRTVKAVVTRMEGETAINLDFLYRTTLYSSDAVGMPTPNNPQSLLGIARIGFLAIDGHLMRSADDGNQFYTGVYTAEAGRFTSGTVFKSNDLGASYNPWLGFSTATFRGIAQSVLPDVPHPEAWDRASTLTFHVASKKGVPNIPSSVTEEALLADDELNGFAIKSGTEWEYIQAAEVIGNTNGTWTLSKLLRGRKGTDFATGGHSIGDIVIYLDTATLDRPPDGEKDLERVYAPIATSTVFTDQYAVHFTNRAKGLRPWAPWGVTGTRDASGNLTIDWFRRDRLGQSWPEAGPEDPPMSETVEAYQVFIYSLSAGILRTISASISEAPYSVADQTTDFGAPVPVGELMVGVVQMSSTFGAGIERIEMI